MAKAFFLAVLLFAWAVEAHAGAIHVAVAANFAPALTILNKVFEQDTGHRIVVSRGSTGKLYAQIRNGAPYDVLLAADDVRPGLLEKEGAAVADSRFVYALGILVLWSADAKLVDSQGAVLRTGKFRHLALANPKTAPYGVAAREALQHLGVWEQIRARLVFGEDIGQTFQFVETGNAELGLVALAQVRTAGDRGSYWRIPTGLYSPIRQEAVLLARAQGNSAAREFIAFMRTDRARRIIADAGYRLP